VVKGRGNKEIATDVGVSERTVKFRLAGIYAKLRVLERTQAAIEAIRRGVAHMG